MTLINIGELVKNVTDEARNEHKDIPWKAIAGMRDLTAHKYQTLRMEDVYNTAVKDIPDFRNQLEMILNEKS
ncbi:HepT-like ribonuclease domain-containing protein [Butyrivibrio sp. AE3006]|uniref:HepT-like ribonuclease domain-containing protein n=1 Tax=Butyrivibrio sp. AE3006 TaxID=1280673 RepID=UPI001FA7EDB0|nr:HepT-like ribonuclease domain-containing protein [Butyrivibrio sp. AE3006]